jgi:hypothetical protein
MPILASKNIPPHYNFPPPVIKRHLTSQASFLPLFSLISPYTIPFTVPLTGSCLIFKHIDPPGEATEDYRLYKIEDIDETSAPPTMYSCQDPAGVTITIHDWTGLARDQPWAHTQAGLGLQSA